jgi:hypothetical protein
LVAGIDELKGRWVGGLQLNPHALGRLKRSVLITSTGSSTRIEGARLTDEICDKTRITKPTVIQALNRLIKLKKIERIRNGKSNEIQEAVMPFSRTSHWLKNTIF